MGTTALANIIARATTTTATTASATSTSTSTSSPDSETRPPVYHVVGIILAISSGLFIGVSFVIKKVGLLKANKKYNEAAGDGYGYLKNAWWWLGMTLMIVGEICNFVAYAFVDAILVTPMGSLSVVVTTILSAIFLKERLSFVGKVGCFMAIVGSIVIVLNAPTESAVANIQEMQHFVISPGFLTYAGVIIVGCVVIALWAGPRYGKKSMLVYLSVCSLIGGLSVVATQGLGAAIVAQVGGESQFKHWFLYVLFVFVIVTLVTEIVYLNKALNIFNAALVTPTYYVYFTSTTIITSAILFQGFKGTGKQIATIVMGFLQICAGVVLLQLSKSAKDVPDTAVFKGDLDQVRTMGEQEEMESEPKADAIRGGAAILRSMSKARARKEVDEVKRIHDERLEPIGEDEQVEWDGLRRRKTVVSSSPSHRGTLNRQRTVHPPLGMTHFPDDYSDVESHDPANDTGIMPKFRKSAHTILNRKPGKDSRSSSMISPKDDLRPHTVALTNMTSPDRKTRFEDLNAGDLGEQQPQVYSLPDSLMRNSSIGLSGMQEQDTSYKSPGVQGSTVTFAPSGSMLSPPPSGPTPPPHGGKRTFSFQNVFGGSRKSQTSPERPNTAASTSTRSFSQRVFSGFGKHSNQTEEEHLGLVHGDSTGGQTNSRDSRATDEQEEEESDLERSDPRLQRGKSRGRDLDDDYDDLAVGVSPERISSSESGGYAKVRRRSDDDDDDDDRPPVREGSFL